MYVNVECKVELSILKTTLHVGVMNKILIFVRSKDMFLQYNCSIILDLDFSFSFSFHMFHILGLITYLDDN
jgi:hypothetical protein